MALRTIIDEAGPDSGGIEGERGERSKALAPLTGPRSRTPRLRSPGTGRGAAGR